MFQPRESHGALFVPSSELVALLPPSQHLRSGQYCVVNLGQNCTVEYKSDRKHAKMLLITKGWRQEDADIDVISVQLTWDQRKFLGEDESVRKSHPGGPIPSVMFFHERALWTFWTARNSGPSAFTGGARRCQHWAVTGRCFCTVEVLDTMPLFVPGTSSIKRPRLDGTFA